jgi:hypothetical protein
VTMTIDHEVERERILVDAVRSEIRELDFRHPAAVVWDLDSTVANTLHRHHMLEPIKKWSSTVKELGEEKAIALGVPKLTWDDYSLACIKDKPYPASVSLMSLLWRTHLQVAVSGRGAIALEQIWKWAKAWKVPLDEIRLRGQEDFRPSIELKVAKIRDLQDQGITVVLYVDDWPADARAVERELGIPSLKVNPDYACLGCGSTERACPCGLTKLGSAGA